MDKEVSYTHGDGALCDEVDLVCLPSYASSNASDMPGDLHAEDVGEGDDFCIQPLWGNENCSAGEWKNTTRGGGDQRPADTSKGDGADGTYGLLTANLGGDWKDPRLEEHMGQDLWDDPCQLICFQEAKCEYIESMTRPLATSAKESLGKGDGHVKGDGRPEINFIGVGGFEKKSGLAIIAQYSIVQGIITSFGVSSDVQCDVQT
jgi:hypothetical protein